MKQHTILFYSAALVFLASCAHAPTAINLNAFGNRYYYAGQYKEALTSYRTALNLAQKNGDAQYEAIALFGMARAHAQLCHASEAEKRFIQSIDARRKLPDLNVAFLTQNLLEFGRFLRSQSRGTEAVVLFDEAIPILREQNFEARDPRGYALVLKEYEEMLCKVGRISEAKTMSEEALRLESEFQEVEPKFTPEGYPSC